MTIKEDIRQTDRRATGIVGDLVAHLDWKMGELPRLAGEFHLSPQATEFLRNHLQEEKNQLLSLPQDADIGEMMENHFQRGDEFRTVVLGKNK